MLRVIKTELDAINAADQDRRAVLEAEKVQLEADRHNYMEKLRAVEERLRSVEQALKSAEEEKKEKVARIYKNVPQGLLPTTGLLLTQ